MRFKISAGLADLATTDNYSSRRHSGCECTFCGEIARFDHVIAMVYSCFMDEKMLAEWVAIGDRLQASGPDKLEEVLTRLTALAEAQEIIAGFDHQLLLRARRPTKRYRA